MDSYEKLTHSLRTVAVNFGDSRATNVQAEAGRSRSRTTLKVYFEGAASVAKKLHMDTYTLGWIAAIILIVIGVAGTVLPALPGTALVLAGVVLGAWLDDFTRVKWWVVAIIAVLAVVAWVTDYLATVMGAKKAGASTLAIVGAALGTIVGIFMGLVGVLFMPFVGAVIGELIAQKNAKQAAKVGLATWLGLLIGTVVKLVLVFMMIGIFVATLLLTA